MFNPSKDWTDEERRKVMIEIVGKMIPPHLPLPQKIHDIGYRLLFLLTESPEFLEANRNHILNGQ